MISGFRHFCQVKRVRILTTITMVILMTGHATFGCCWHHAHASEGACDNCPVVAHHDDSDHHEHGNESQAAHCGHDHQDGEKSLASHDEPDPAPSHETCDEANCVFVRTDDGQSLTPRHSDINVTMSVSEVGLAAVDVCAAGQPSGSHYRCGKPPLRPHLLLQILLI